ncbi:MAG: hypothetical protein FH756_00405 [Firmicutes bacterium]|nr:hypothetical protein [Bacillota bacterium]
MKKTIITLIMIAIFLIIAPPTWATNKWEYSITNMDTPTVIDQSQTTADVDTQNNEISLPRFNPGAAAFWPDGSPDYIVMTPTEIKHYSWTGSQTVENTVLSVPGQNNPLSIAAPAPYPDVVVVDKDRGATHYSFTGNDMVENPALSVADLSGVLFVGAREDVLAGLVDEEVRAYKSGSRDTSLEPSVDLSNPMGLSLYPDRNNMAILEPDRVRFFMDTGTQMVENPALSVTGLTNPKAIGTGNDLDTAIVDGNQVKHYSFDGSSLRYNNTLSVNSGLTTPTCVALRPGSNDRIIVDGNEVKYYRFKNGSLNYDPDRSTTVTGLDQLGGYAPKATVVSQVKNTTVDTTFLRIRAYHALPQGTSVTWHLTTDGTNFTEAMRLKNDTGTAICEAFDPDTLSWTNIGSATKAGPDQDTKELWIELPAGRDIIWKAVLETDDPEQTPKVIKNDVAVVWEAGNPPEKPDLNLPAQCYVSTTPTINWSFSDPDPGDTQSGYQVIIRKQSDGTLVYDSGTVFSSEPEFKIPTSEQPDVPGPLWASGEHEFTVEVRTFDAVGIPSEWSDPAEFCIVGLERPRIKELVSPGAGQTPPVPDQPSTYLVVKKGMTEDELPLTKAGGKVGMLVDSIGPLNSLDAVFPYLNKEATVHKIENIGALGSSTNRWLVEFWTEASIEECPDGTIVEMDMRGYSTEGDTKLSTVDAPPYAAGVVKTMGSVYEDWVVVLKGRDN